MLVLLILTGLFIDPSKSLLGYTLLGISTIVTIIVLVQTSGNIGFFSGFWWYNNWPMIALALFILIAIAIIVGSSSKKTTSSYNPMWLREYSGADKGADKGAD